MDERKIRRASYLLKDAKIKWKVQRLCKLYDRNFALQVVNMTLYDQQMEATDLGVCSELVVGL